MGVRSELEPLPRRRGVGAGGDAAEPRHEEDTRLRREHRRRSLCVPLVERGVPVLELVDPLVPVEHAGADADPEHVVRRPPLRRDRRRVGPVGEIALAGIDREHLPPLARHAAAQPCK